MDDEFLILQVPNLPTGLISTVHSSDMTLFWKILNQLLVPNIFQETHSEVAVTGRQRRVEQNPVTPDLLQHKATVKRHV